MRDHILILGGYGNFGKRIAINLSDANIPITIAGRGRIKAQKFAQDLGTDSDIAIFDVNADLPQYLDQYQPRIVINTCGPFQNANYAVAQACAERGLHYIDLADGRDFVTGITTLNAVARNKRAAIISGASTVPGLSSAVLEHFKPDFSEMTSLKFGISPGQQAERGLATTQGIMSYVGKPLAPHPSKFERTYGWQNIYRQTYPDLGARWMANCDIPDLDLLPAQYGLKEIQFSAGMELGFLHLGIWALSGLIRAGIPLNLEKHANLLLNASNVFNIFGSADGGMHVIVKGRDQQGQPLTRKWFIIAKSGDGPHIPTIPAIIIAKKLWAGEKIKPGAYPCVGIVTLNEYLDELKQFDIKTYQE